MSRLVRAKIVMVGGPGVGKSSLVRRFVHSSFSADYHSTLGVKIDRRTVSVGESTVSLVLWDMHGETDGLDVPPGYLRGARAALVVIDATRPETITTAVGMKQRILEESQTATVRLIANKADLYPDWDALEQSCLDAEIGTPSRTSAKTGDGVEEIFDSIAAELAGS